MISSNQTRQLLDIDKILKFYSKHVRSEIGRKYVRKHKTLVQYRDAKGRQALYREFERYIDIKGDFPWDDRLVPVNDLLNEGKSRGILFGEETLAFQIFARTYRENKRAFL
jgi:DNA mismatch repair protein MutS2